MSEEIPIGEFFEEFFNALKDYEYGQSSISIRKRHCDKILEFANKSGKNSYSVALGTSFLEAYFQTQDNNKYEQMTVAGASRVFRTVSMLNDFYTSQPFKNIYLKPQNTILNNKQLKLIDGFIKYLTNRGFAKASLDVFKRVSKRYFEFFNEEDMVLKDLGVRDVEHLLTVFREHKPITMKKNIQVLKHLVRFLYESGEITTDFSENIPYPRIYRKSGIPSVWPTEDLERIMNAIDLNSAIGKRNKVILLLASRLGLRGSDIRNLKFSDIDWDNDTISFIQSKTKEPITLPLIPEVGEAIIEYLRYGRPKSKREEIILGHNAPYEPFKSNTGFNNIIIRYANKAGVKLTSERKHGIHSLRHTFASALLKQNVTPTIIAGLLGHTSSENVSVYLKAQDEALRECCLNIEEVIASGR